MAEKRFIRGKCLKWFAEKGYGFVQIETTNVFVYASSVKLAEVLQLNDDAVIKIMKDTSQKDERWKATEAWAPAEWQAEMALRASLRAAENAKQAAGQALEANERSLLSVQSARMMRPPGLVA